MLTRFLSILFILTTVFSCQRKAVHKVQEAFIGGWIHHDENGEHWYISIDNKSWGTITVYDANNNDLMRFGENPHRWRYNEKKQLLTLRIIPDKFHINLLPTTATSMIINQKDTIQMGDTYCILDGMHFKKYTD
jgi:hypothetical protein